MIERALGKFEQFVERISTVSCLGSYKIRAYVWAIALCGLALAIRLAIAPLESGIQYVTFFPAVTLAAVVGGVRGGALATGIGVALATYVFTPPYYSLSIGVFKTTFWSNLVFMMDGAIVSLSIEGLNRYRRKYAAELAEATATNVTIAESSQHLKRIIDNLFAYVALLDPEGVVLEVNNAPLERAGLRYEDAIGRNFSDAPWWSYDADVQQQLISAIQAAQRGQSSRYDVVVKMGGDLVPIDFQISAVRDASGTIVGLLPTGVDITARKRIEDELCAREAISHQLSVQAQSSAAHLRSIFDASPDALLISDDRGLIVMANQQVETLLGYTSDELLGQSVDVLVPLRFRNAHSTQRHQFMQSSSVWRAGQGLEAWALRKDGGECEVEISLSKVQTDHGSFIASALHDITQRRLSERESRIAAVAFNAQESTMITDAKGVILKVNPAFTETTGYALDEILGQTPSILKSGRHDKTFYAAMWNSINQTGGWTGEVWDRRKNGEIYPKLLNIAAVKDSNGAVTNYIGTHFDITLRKQAEERINTLAFFDQLTGLPNRTLLVDRLNQAMSGSARSRAFGALLFIDLDNFKTINDTLGHDVGDLLLKLVAARLTSCVRSCDTVARLGGDEFVLMLVGLSFSASGAASQVDVVGDKVLRSLNEPYRLRDSLWHSTPSIGVTLFRGQETNIDDLLRQADIAMYKSKAAGRNAIHFFDPEMETAMIKRADLESDLRTALHQDQFVLYYQPQIRNGTELIGAEALVRWRHPSRGMVSPVDFIPLAEETGLILPLGQWVLEAACQQLALWASHPQLADLNVAVNVSAHQIRDSNFVGQVLDVLGRTGANPHSLKLELTESLMVENVQDIIGKMSALKALGVRFALDDFGTGYSSLSYLKQLPLNTLKIDRSFVLDVLVDPNDAAIARTIVTLAQSLDLSVIAEGVETREQMEFLADIGCRIYQGYFFSKPLPIDDFEAFAQAGYGAALAQNPAIGFGFKPNQSTGA